MNLLFRLFFLPLFSKFRTSVPSLGPCRTPFRCWPTDLDVLRHMNNGKYFSLMDIARIDLMKRAGIAKELINRGWYPVVAAETARFKKSIRPFRRFEIETKVIGWDEKAILLQQTFLQNEVTVCEAIVRARFLKKKGGSVHTQELLEALNITEPTPQPEEWISEWNQQQK